MQGLLNLVQTSFARKPQGECIICMQEYKDDDDVTPLPCHETHYFHTACLQGWLRNNNTCPLCRARIPRTMSQINAAN